MKDNKCIKSFSSKVRRVQIRGSASKSLRISSERKGGNEAVRETQYNREKKNTESIM